MSAPEIRRKRTTQGGRHRGEAEHEAPPEPGDAAAEGEAEHDRRGEPERPVARDVRDEREAGLAGAPQDPRADRLHPVGDLEHGGDPEEGHRRGEDGGVVGHEARDRAGEREEQDPARGHERRPGPEGGQARAARADPIPGADGAPHADGPGVPEPDRGREREARDRDRELVRRERQGAEPRGEEADEREDPDLRAHVQPHRQADAHRAGELRRIGPAGRRRRRRARPPRRRGRGSRAAGRCRASSRGPRRPPPSQGPRGAAPSTRAGRSRRGRAGGPPRRSRRSRRSWRAPSGG